MPQIAEYNAPAAESLLRPDQGGSEAWARAGMRISEFGERAGQSISKAIASPGMAVAKIVNDHLESVDKSEGGQKLIDYNLSQQKAYNEQSQGWNPDDIEAPQKFLEQYNNGLQDVVGTARTQARQGSSWKRRSQAMYDHMGEVQIADASHRSGVARWTQTQSQIAGPSQTVANDVSFLPTAMSQLDHIFDAAASGGNLATRDREEILSRKPFEQNALAMNAYQAALSKDPSRAMALLKGGYFTGLTNPGEAQRLGQEAIKQAQAQATSQAYLGLAMKREAEGQAANKFISDNIGFDRPRRYPTVHQARLGRQGV